MSIIRDLWCDRQNILYSMCRLKMRILCWKWDSPNPDLHLQILMLTHRPMEYKWHWRVIISPHLLLPHRSLLCLFLYCLSCLSCTNLPSFAHHTPIYYVSYHNYFPYFVVPSLDLSPLFPFPPSLPPLLRLCPHRLSLIFSLFLSRFSSPMYRVVSGGCGMTLWGNRSLPSSLETSTAPPRSTEVTTGYLPFASSSLSPYLLY